MKRFLGILTVVVAVTAVVSSCRKVVRDVTSGIVDELTDSTLIVKIDGSRVIFDVRETKFSNGMVMYGDSVVINYIGDLSEKRAFAEVVRLIPRPGNVVIIDHNAPVDTTKELLSHPIDDANKEKGRMKRAAEVEQFLKK